MTSRVLAGLRGRGELVLAALLLVLGIFVLVETSRIEVPATANALGPRFFPTVVGWVLCVLGVWLGVDILRGGHGEMDEGEDVDTSAPSDWRTIGIMTAAFALHVVTVTRLGWFVAGAILFYGVAFALGSRRHLRDVAVAVVLSLVVYLVFAKALGVTLPAGILEGVL